MTHFGGGRIFFQTQLWNVKFEKNICPKRNWIYLWFRSRKVLNADRFHDWDENFSSEKISKFGPFLMHAWKAVVHLWKNHHLTEKTWWCKVFFTDELWKTIFELAKPSIAFLSRKLSQKLLLKFSVFSTFPFRIVRFVRKCLNTIAPKKFIVSPNFLHKRE